MGLANDTSLERMSCDVPPYDVTFDFRSDTPRGDDPDSSSPTLRCYHKHLWSKPLPRGGQLTLDDQKPGGYLYHASELDEFWFTSDAVVPSYRSWARFGLPDVVAQFPTSQLDEFDRIGYTIGGMMIFPSWNGERGRTINQARGMLTRVADRMDLTLECIRRHYVGEASPMTSVLTRYSRFFEPSTAFWGTSSSSCWRTW